VNSNGQNVTAQFEYSTSYCPSASQPGAPVGVQNVNGSSNISYTLSGLNQNTIYFYNAVAFASNATKVYGSCMQFTPTTNTITTGDPTVNTFSPSNVTTSGATLNGTVNTNGNQSVTTYFEYAQNYCPTSGQGGTQVGSQVFSNGSYNMTYTLGGLQPNTTYRVSAVAYGLSGLRVYGGCQTFTTTGNSYYYNPPVYSNPTVTTNAATNVTSNSAVLNGSIYPNGSTNNSVYFEWGTDYNLANRTNSQYIDGFTTNFNANLNIQLNPNTTYYYRAAALSQNGTIARGQIMSFSTNYGNYNYNYQQPIVGNLTVNTTQATEIFSDSARLNCTVGWNSVSNSYVSTWFEYGTTQNLGNQTAVQSVGQNAVCSRVALNLSPNTTYYFRAVGQIPGGAISRGQTLSFMTGIAQPTFVYNNTPVYTYTQTNTTKTTTSSAKATLNKEVANLSFPNGTKTAIAALAGNTIEYAITVANTGNSSMNGAVLRDKLSQFTTFVSGSDQAYLDASTGEVVWNLPTISAGESKVVTLRVTANQINENVVAENVAKLTAGSASKTSNTTIAIIHQIPLLLSMVPDRDRALPGESVNFTVNYKNDGKSALSGATLHVILPAGMDYQSSNMNLVREDANSYQLSVGNIDAQGQGAVTITAVVAKDVQIGKTLTANAVMTYNDAFMKRQIDVNTYSNLTVGTGSAAPTSAINQGANQTAEVGVVAKSGFFPESLLGWLGLILLIVVLVILIRKNI
jgi:uncharacterized repeat protein (TIGR01451 family)